MVAHCERVQIDEAARTIQRCRADVRRLAESSVSAALHIFVGEIAAKHGATQLAKRHTNLGLRLLAHSPNYWLRAWGENTLVGLALIDGDVSGGMAHAEAAIQAAEVTGAAAIRSAALINLGNLSVLEGSWTKAKEYFERAEGLSTENGKLHR